MPRLPTSGVLLRLDGVLHGSDLPVQAFARHLTEHLPAELVAPLIAGMRGFLEDKPELVPVGTDFGPAEDGYQAVERLARTAGLTTAQVAAAAAASRRDLAASAWAVDAPDELIELLTDLGPAVAVGVFSGYPDPAADPAGTDPAGDDPTMAAVLDALELERPVDLLPGPLPAAIELFRARLAAGSPLLVVGTRWAGELDLAAAAGCSTALVDRYQLRRGSPDRRATELAGLVDQIRAWATQEPRGESGSKTR